MDVARLREIGRSPSERRARYRELVRGFYDLVTDDFESEWGDSQHCGLFATPDEPVADAVARVERFLVARSGIGAGMRVLDLGAGLGGPARQIGRLTGARITGVDLTPRRVRLAARRGTGDAAALIDFLAADAMALPFRDGAFDAIYSFEMVQHIPDKAALYREAARVLRPGGICAGTDWYHADGLDEASLERRIEPICRLTGMPSLTSLAQLRGMLVAAGFRAIEAGDLAAHGDVTPNFTRVSARAAADLGRRDEIDAKTLLLAESGLALREAFDAGAFLMGYWVAMKGDEG
jgi:SAM-dependent methyltransferase